MPDINPFASPPIFRYEEVISQADLEAIREGYILQWQRTKWYQFIRRYQFRIALGTINALFTWINEGKAVKEKM